jgi:putative FmdB family regulatory protein
MPLFEYSCRDCGKRFTFLAGVVAGNDDPRCPQCQSENLKKLISRFSSGRSDDERMEALGDKLETQDFDDPRQLRRFAREMGREMGAETGENMADEMEAMLEAEASGEGDSEGGFGGASGGGGDDGTIY